MKLKFYETSKFISFGQLLHPPLQFAKTVVSSVCWLTATIHWKPSLYQTHTIGSRSANTRRLVPVRPYRSIMVFEHGNSNQIKNIPYRCAFDYETRLFTIEKYSHKQHTQTQTHAGKTKQSRNQSCKQIVYWNYRLQSHLISIIASTATKTESKSIEVYILLTILWIFQLRLLFFGHALVGAFDGPIWYGFRTAKIKKKQLIRALNCSLFASP